jgi:hypothetical protein
MRSRRARSVMPHESAGWGPGERRTFLGRLEIHARGGKCRASSIESPPRRETGREPLSLTGQRGVTRATLVADRTWLLVL